MVLYDLISFLENEVKKKNNYIFRTDEIPNKIKNQLKQKNMIYSPFKWVCIIKKSNWKIEELLDDYFVKSVAYISGVISGEFVLNYLLEKDVLETRNMLIYAWWKYKKQFVEWKYSLQAKVISSKIEEKKIRIDWVSFKIETPVSYVINNIKIIEKLDKTSQIQVLSKLDLDRKKIKKMITWGFKISGFSRLGILYKNLWYRENASLILSEIKNAWKQIDYRNSNRNNVKIKIKTAKNKKQSNTNINLDDLI